MGAPSLNDLVVDGTLNKTNQPESDRAESSLIVTSEGSGGALSLHHLLQRHLGDHIETNRTRTLKVVNMRRLKIRNKSQLYQQVECEVNEVPTELTI